MPKRTWFCFVVFRLLEGSAFALHLCGFQSRESNVLRARPHYVTMGTIVRDAVARLPEGRGMSSLLTKCDLTYDVCPCRVKK